MTQRLERKKSYELEIQLLVNEFALYHKVRDSADQVNSPVLIITMRATVTGHTRMKSRNTSVLNVL